MNWMLIVVLGIIVISALLGMKVGFIKTAFSLVSMIIALILTVWLSPYVNDLLKNNEKINDKINDQVGVMLSLKEKEEIAPDQEAFIKSLPLPKSFKDTLVENMDERKGDLKDYIAEYITGVIINALAFALTFIAILVILWIISLALNIISMLPIIHQINKLAGLAAGLVQGLVIVWVLFICLTVFGGSKFGQDAFVMIEESVVLSLIYNNNMLLSFVTNTAKLLL